MDDPRLVKWFAPAERLPQYLYEKYLEALAHTAHKADILIDAAELPERAQNELLQRLSHHPKVRTIILFKPPAELRTMLAAHAAMLGINLRFCDSDAERRLLISKRRSQVIAIETPELKVPQLFDQLRRERRSQPFEPTNTYVTIPFDQ